MRTIKILAAPAICAAAVAALVGSAGGASPVTREEAAASLAARFHAFDTDQSAADVFESKNPEYAQTAEFIAATSRRVAADADGEAYAFLNRDDQVCVLYRPTERTFGASSCGPADGDKSPAVLVYFGPQTTSALVAGLTQDGASRVVASDASGEHTVPMSGANGFVYRARTPFTLTWTEPSGRAREIRAVGTDIGKLRRAG